MATTTVKAVVVTGAASGIGAATCALLESEGWRVIGTDVADGPNVRRLDVTNEADWDTVLDEAGPIDGLVSCAGIRTCYALVDLSVEDWEHVLRVNVTGTFLGIRGAIRRWLDAGTTGSIVTVASINSFVAVPKQAHYVASKAAVAMLTKAAALEVAGNGIRVNAVAPGPVMTGMIGARLAEPGQREWLESKVPMGRIADPSEVATTISFLLSDRASYITGAVIPVDGGWLAG